MSDTLAHIFLVREARLEHLASHVLDLCNKIETFHSKLRERDDSLGDPCHVENRPPFLRSYCPLIPVVEKIRRDGHAA